MVLNITAQLDQCLSIHERPSRNVQRFSQPGEAHQGFPAFLPGSLPGLSWALLGLSRAFLGSTGLSWTLPGLSWALPGLPAGISNVSPGLRNFQRFSCALPGSPGLYPGSPEFSRGSQQGLAAFPPALGCPAGPSGFRPVGIPGSHPSDLPPFPLFRFCRTPPGSTAAITYLLIYIYMVFCANCVN